MWPSVGEMVRREDESAQDLIQLTEKFRPFMFDPARVLSISFSQMRWDRGATPRPAREFTPAIGIQALTILGQMAVISKSS